MADKRLLIRSRSQHEYLHHERRLRQVQPRANDPRLYWTLDGALSDGRVPGHKGHGKRHYRSNQTLCQFYGQIRQVTLYLSALWFGRTTPRLCPPVGNLWWNIYAEYQRRRNYV